MVRSIVDGLVNVVASLGTARDKAAHNAYVYSALSYDQLLASYRSAWLPRAIVDIPAKDAIRKWRAWQANADQISAIEKVEKRLQVQNTVLQGLTAARLYGGAAIYIGTKDRDPSKPIDPAGIGGVRSLTVLTPAQISPGEISRDIDGDYFGRPEFYELSGDGKDPVKIHASRLVVLEGSSVPDITRRMSGWGDSVLQSTMDAVMQADSACANISSLIFEAKVDVFRFKGFGDQLAQGADDVLTRRLSAQAAMKGINGAVVLDMEDEYNQKSASFGGLPDLMDRFMNNVSGASRIPVTRLFGRASVGLSGTGDGDERVYFDHVQQLQSSEIEPALRMLDECIIWEALGSRPEEIFYEWQPLRQVTERERAEIFKVTADAARALAGANAGELVPTDALSAALVTELAEQGVLPGLEQKIAEYGTLAEQELNSARESVALAAEAEQSSNATGRPDVDGRAIPSGGVGKTLGVVVPRSQSDARSSTFVDFDPAQPRIPAGNPAGGRWVEASFSSDDEVASDMADILKNSDYDHFGIRVDDLDDPQGLGDTLPKSRIWVDGEPTEEFLRGTSTYGVKADNDSVSKGLNAMGLNSSGKGDGYYGKVIYLVGGYDSFAGEDIGERVIQEAVVVGVYIRGKSSFAPVNWRLEGGKQTQSDNSVADAVPRTLYVRRDVLNGAEIIAWAKEQGFEATLPVDDLHVTIAYSRRPIDWMRIGEAWQSKLELPEGGPRLMEQFGEAKVLLFKASELEWRHEAIKEAGASWDHPEFQPHVTISYGPMPACVEPYQGKIILGPERFEEVQDGWQQSIREE